MKPISFLPVFTGVIPNKATQTDYDFANNIFGFLNYSGNTLIPYMNDTISDLNILSGEINTAASATATNAQTAQTAYQQAQTAIALLNAGAIDDTTIATNKAYSNQKINALFTNREDKIGSNIASAATTVIGTAGLGNTILITGTTTITSFGTATTAGTRRTLLFDNTLSINHGASIICPGAMGIVATVGTVVEVVAYNTTVWKVISILNYNISNEELGHLDGVTSNLQVQLGSKAPIASPTFTGIPATPTATTGTNTTQVASTAFANSAVDARVGVANSSIVKTALNATGAAPIFACRVWANFNGTGVVAIMASGNASSITDNGVGDYTVNFTTAMPDTNYSTLCTGTGEGATDNDLKINQFSPIYSTTQVRLIHMGSTFSDCSKCNVSIFR